MSALVPYFNGSWWLSSSSSSSSLSSSSSHPSSLASSDGSSHPLVLGLKSLASDWAQSLQCFLEDSTLIAQNISNQLISGNFSSVWDIFGPESRDFVTNLELTDFQWKLVWEFSLILLGNAVLVILAWRIYGPRIIQRFFSPGGRKVLQDLRLSMSELKLPKEHDFKYK